MAGIGRKLGISKGTPLKALSKIQLLRLLEGDSSLSYTSVFEREADVSARCEWGGLLNAIRTIWHYTKLPRLRQYRRREVPGLQRGAPAPAALP